MDELGMVGLTMNTSILDRAITDAEFEPVFAELDRRAAILNLHPAGNGACSPLVNRHRITWMVGAPFEDTIAAMQLITSGHLQRYPAVKVVCSHLGGALPMITRRADDHVAWEAPDTPEEPSRAVRRLWYDTVSHCHAPALRCAIDSFGADRLLLGTDFPYEDGDTSSARSTTSTTQPIPGMHIPFGRPTRWRCSGSDSRPGQLPCVSPKRSAAPVPTNPRDRC
jgi:aminocarboxymuconate-semialdehyde decarboxylase